MGEEASKKVQVLIVFSFGRDSERERERERETVEQWAKSIPVNVQGDPKECAVQRWRPATHEEKEKKILQMVALDLKKLVDRMGELRFEAAMQKMTICNKILMERSARVIATSEANPADVAAAYKTIHFTVLFNRRIENALDLGFRGYKALKEEWSKRPPLTEKATAKRRAEVTAAWSLARHTTDELVEDELRDLPMMHETMEKEEEDFVKECKLQYESLRTYANRENRENIFAALVESLRELEETRRQSQLPPDETVMAGYALLDEIVTSTLEHTDMIFSMAGREVDIDSDGEEEDFHLLADADKREADLCIEMKELMLQHKGMGANTNALMKGGETMKRLKGRLVTGRREKIKFFIACIQRLKTDASDAPGQQSGMLWGPVKFLLQGRHHALRPRPCPSL